MKGGTLKFQVIICGICFVALIFLPSPFPKEGKEEQDSQATSRAEKQERSHQELRGVAITAISLIFTAVILAIIFWPRRDYRKQLKVHRPEEEEKQKEES